MNSDSKLTYRAPRLYEREFTAKELASGDDMRVRDAMVSMAFYETDWRLAQDKFLELLEVESVRGLAATCLGHVARIHEQIDHEKVWPALLRHRHDPLLHGQVDDALDDIDMFAPREGYRL